MKCGWRAGCPHNLTLTSEVSMDYKVDKRVWKKNHDTVLLFDELLRAEAYIKKCERRIKDLERMLDLLGSDE